MQSLPLPAGNPGFEGTNTPSGMTAMGTGIWLCLHCGEGTETDKTGEIMGVKPRVGSAEPQVYL